MYTHFMHVHLSCFTHPIAFHTFFLFNENTASTMAFWPVSFTFIPVTKSISSNLTITQPNFLQLFDDGYYLGCERDDHLVQKDIIILIMYSYLKNYIQLLYLLVVDVVFSKSWEVGQSLNITDQRKQTHYILVLTFLLLMLPWKHCGNSRTRSCSVSWR
jgi:hypothetical protein